MLTHAYNIVIDRIFGAPVHDREVVGGLNATDKRFFSVFITTVQLSSESSYSSHMAMHTSTLTIDISLERGLQKHPSESTPKHGVMDNGKQKKVQ